jgi:hypothetical protein
MPDVLEDRGPRSHTNTGTDKHSDFVLEYIFGRGTVRAVDSESRHLITVLKGNFVHTHGVNIVVELGLGSTSTESITQLSGEVTNLANVDRHIRVKGARSDGKRVPLVLGKPRHLEEQPLTSLVLERRLVELDLNHVIRMADNSGDLGLTSSTNFTPETLEKVETTSPELPSPSKITNAVLPELVTREW